MTQALVLRPLVQNTKAIFNTSPAIDRVKIQNESGFYLLVYYGSDAPIDQNAPGWHDTVVPGDKPLLGIVGASVSSFTDRNYVQSTPYLGTITILPFLPAGAQAPVGVLNGGAFCAVTGYFPGEYAESGTQSDAFVQATKQGRTQAVLGGVQPQIGTTTQATANKTRIGTAVTTLTPAIAPNIFAANAATTTLINFYIYHYFAWVSPGAGTVGATWSLEVAVTNAAGTVDRASSEIGRYGFNGDFTAASNINQTSVIEQPMPHPLVVPLGIAQNALVSGDIAVVRINNLVSLNGYNLFHNIGALVDIVNQTPLTDVPTLLNALGFFPPYNASFNPQTW